MKRIEVKMLIDFDEKQTNSEIVQTNLMNEIDDTINGVVKLVSLIDEFEVA
jgi:hypothetical protein